MSDWKDYKNDFKLVFNGVLYSALCMIRGERVFGVCCHDFLIPSLSIAGCSVK